MLLDEPFGALDPITRDRLQRCFSKIQRTVGVTAVLVTHDMSEALLLADRVAVLKEGTLVQFSTPRELLASPADPYVEELLAIPKANARAVERLRGDSS
jgi:osmoprotectant transport system ATP-binding protein